MTISCRLRVVLAQLNVERAKMGQPSMSLRRLSQESGVSLSVLAALHTGRNQRIDYVTIDRLLTYFNRFFPIGMNDLFRWEALPEDLLLPPESARWQPVQPGLG
jgi:DNA-binding Xre family transcriptional regulator